MSPERKSEKRNDIKLPELLDKMIDEMAKSYKCRDPERIDKILAVLGELWKLQPDTRLGQLLMNFCFRYRENTVYISRELLDIYEQEDDLTLELLQKKLDSEKAAKS